MNSFLLQRARLCLRLPAVRRHASKKQYPPHTVVNMPALSPTMTHGNIGPWHRRVGDAVQPGDVLCEIETDKAQMDFEAPEEGYLAKVLMGEGTKEPLAVLVEDKESVEQMKDFEPPTGGQVQQPGGTEAKEPVQPAKAEPDKQPTRSSEPAQPSTTGGQERSRRIASPAARAIAREQNIDLSTITGTGPGQRITKADVLDAKAVSGGTPSAPKAAPEFVDMQLSSVRRVIAQRLTESKQTIPHYYLKVAFDATRMQQFRSEVNSSPDEKRVSVNDIIIKASALACMQVPEANSSWMGSFIRQYAHVDVSVAVATPSGGLITPIIRYADRKSLLEIAAESRELAGRARQSRLRPEEFQGGTFTVSNLGMYGIDAFTAIINPPQSCILAVGAVRRDANDRQTMSVTLSCDHRVVDGATGAKWLQHFRRFMEDPATMLLV